MAQHRRFVAEIVNYLRRILTPSSTATASASPPGTCAKRWPTRSPTSGRPWAPWPRSTARRHETRSYLLACRGWSFCRRGVNAGAKTANRRATRTRLETRTDEDWGEPRSERARANGGPLLTIVVVRIPSRGGEQSIVSLLHRLSRNIDKERSSTTVALFFLPHRTNASAMCAWLHIRRLLLLPFVAALHLLTTPATAAATDIDCCGVLVRCVCVCVLCTQ